MSGSGNHDSQPNRALGGKIKEEVLSALKLLFKNAEQHSVSVLLETNLTIYSTHIMGDYVDVPLEEPQANVSMDPIRILKEQAPSVDSATLIGEVFMAEASPCHVEPTLCHEPVYDELAFESHGITFNNLWAGQNRHWPVERLKTRTTSQPIDNIPKPAVEAAAGGPLSARVVSLPDRLQQAIPKSDPRFYALPIRKMAIPPHRFSVEAREVFRKALAEKTGTHAANVQLKMVFERMNMALYASIQPDELGLLCVPKNELLGRNRETVASQALLSQQHSAVSGTYLVVGIRLDNKEDIRTLVPVETVLNATPGGRD